MLRFRFLKYHLTLFNVIVFITAAGAFLFGLLLLWAVTLKIPDLSSFSERRVIQSTKIYDRTGTILLYNLQQNAKRTVVPLDHISRNIKNATVAIEDAEFYQHHGIKPSSIIRAIFVNLTSLNFSQGGSTITQQVVKNSLLTSEKQVSRKLKEWILALKLERVFSKEQILQIYLNETPYGGSLYGVEEASEAFFGKSAMDLTLAESAYIAALPQAPTYYSPHGNHRNSLEERKNLVLQKMLENKFVSKEEFAKAEKEKVTFLPPSDTGIKAPHFVFFVREYLEAKYGKSVVDEGGLKVITTLDYALEQRAEEIVKKFALENKEKFNAENASLVAIDPKTGQILVMVGSRDYFDKEIDGNFNVTLGKRQPGSAFKPFVYATAFAKGYTPETVLFDLETEFSTSCSPEGEPLSPDAVCYKPTNYDGVFRGPVTLREALAQSLNIPSVKTLYLAGIKESIETARDMGISTLTDASRYGLTLVLGGGEVTLLDLTSAYGGFANDGVRNPYAAILRIEDSVGNVLEEFTPSEKMVIDKNVARTISDILSDNKARAPSFGDRSYLYFPSREVAAKTGTTNDYRDAWIVGYTPSFVAGAWAGNNDNSPMEKKVAGFIIAPLWNAFMVEALKTLPDEHFAKPEVLDNASLKPVLRGFWQGGQSYFIDRFSGNLATDLTPGETREEKVVKNVHSILYWLNKNDPLGPPTDPKDDPQFVRWELPIRKWVLSKGIIEENDSVIPKNFDTIHLLEKAPRLSIGGLNSINKYTLADRLSVSVTESFGAFPLSRVDFYINGGLVGSASQAPFQLSFVPAEIESIGESNLLRVVGYDSVFNKGEAKLEFSVETN